MLRNVLDGDLQAFFEIRAPFLYSKSAGFNALVSLWWGRTVWQKFYFYSMALPNPAFDEAISNKQVG